MSCWRQAPLEAIIISKAFFGEIELAAQQSTVKKSVYYERYWRFHIREEGTVTAMC